jgi:cell wall-associated NlpC family hydrolase
MRRISIAALVAGLASLVAGWLALGAAGSDRTPAPALAPRAAATAAAPRAAAVAADSEAGLPPLPTKTHARVVQPVAGGAAGTGAADVAVDPGLSGTGDAKPTRAASAAIAGEHPASGGSNAVTHAVALPNGVALPPLEAPEAVKQIIQAGNGIARTPYIWGGGHGKWLDKGYDCSGSVSFVLASAGLLSVSETSGQLMSFGEAGPGKWVTIYASDGHVFLEVAGIRFDTGAQSVTGSRWANTGRTTAGFVARHPAGL